MARSVAKIKKKYGKDAFRKWGKKGGNKLLIMQGKGYKFKAYK